MFCMNCGAKNDAEGRFCVECGAPLHADATAAAPEPTASASVQPPATQPISAQPAAPAPAQTAESGVSAQPTTPAPTQPATAASATAQTASAAVKARRGWVKPLAITLVIALVAAGCGLGAFLTWRAGIWGGKIVPNTSDFQPAAGQSLTADVVAKQLNDRGIATQITQIYSGKPKGDFVGLEGAKAGDRIQQGQTVTVQESLGPGVPADVMGKQAADIAAQMSDMGVPVTYKQVAVSDQSQTPEGSVVVTSPQAGQPVPDDQKDKGISIGVATKGSGLGWDVVGQDADSVRSDLKSKGYTVTLAKKLASKQYKGKVVSSDPLPGSKLTPGQSITLYEGVDADDLNDMIIWKVGPYQTLYYLQAIAGTYCKATVTDPSKDCMTFTPHKSGSYGDDGVPLYQTWGTETDTSFSTDDMVSQCFATNGGDVGRCTIADDGSSGYSVTYGGANRLAARKLGAFDFGKGGEGAQCGSEAISTWFQGCSNGTAVASSSMGDGPFDGATYEMHDFFAYFAAGANLDAIESNGYFDADALAKATGEKAVDNDRPFILYRDPSQYSATSVPVTKDNAEDNPFVPSSEDANDVKFKPAPTDANAYYLVENVQPDWDELPDADVAVPQKDAGASPSPSATSTSLADIRKAAQGGDFSAIAGKYCRKDNTVCLTLDKTGKITSSGNPGYPYMSPGDPTSAKLHVSTGKQGDTWFAPDPDAGIELRGPDSDFQCGGNKGYKACYQSGGSYSEADITKPFDVVYIPAGVDSSKYDSLGGVSYEDYQEKGKARPDSSKPFLKIMEYHMNVPPMDSNVLYLIK